MKTNQRTQVALGQYDLKSINLPRLAGNALRTATQLLENPVTRQPLLRRLLREAGITGLRARTFTESPLFQPLFSYENQAASEASSPFTLDALLALAQQHPTGYASILDYAQAYRSGAVTPEQVAQKVLTAIADSDAHNPPLRAFIACNHEDILAQARLASERFKEGKPLSPLDGVPIAVKDELDQTPYPTTLGTRILNSLLTGQDATVVARLRAAGALLIGKTNMHEFGVGVTGLNTHHGTPRNPYHPNYHTGGSSSGSAAAVAAGLCPVAIGVDGGGSVRIPAAFCGVVGLKPTYGRISAFGSAALGCSVCQTGPIAATVRDAALVYTVIAGPDPRDRATLRQPPVHLTGFEALDVSGLTLGVYRPWFEHASPAIVEICTTLLRKFAEKGVQIKEIQLPELDNARIAHAIIILSEMAVAVESFYNLHRRDFGLDVRTNLALARSFTARDYIQAQRVRARFTEHLQQAFKTVDVIVTPATGCSAPPIRLDALHLGESDLGLLTEIMRFAVPANFAGLPAISFPAGYDPQGLPVGFHAMGRPWEEHVLLRLANAAEGVVERRLAKVHHRVLPNT